ncbi:hypothetical protein EAF04_000186 [Stromatinia cepivora]|nr:hypothetical protein EAF04_000186 [Stromatinia cepivora]
MLDPKQLANSVVVYPASDRSYCSMYATLAMGGSSHKQMDKKVPRAMQLYYTNKNVLFTVCAMNELFFIALYLLSFSSPIPISTMMQADGQLGSIAPGNPPDPSLIWTNIHT